MTTKNYFANGITEDIVSELSKHRDLSVVARSAFAYKDQPVNATELGRKFGADVVMTGGIRLAQGGSLVCQGLIAGATVLWLDPRDRAAYGRHSFRYSRISPYYTPIDAISFDSAVGAGRRFPAQCYTLPGRVALGRFRKLRHPEWTAELCVGSRLIGLEVRTRLATKQRSS